jgi:hypothetical protein
MRAIPTPGSRPADQPFGVVEAGAAAATCVGGMASPSRFIRSLIWAMVWRKASPSWLGSAWSRGSLTLSGSTKLPLI